MSVHLALLEEHTGFRRAQSRLEHATQRTLRSGQPLRAGITVIPVVVNVLWRTSSENISDAQVHSQIAVLNRDYRATNSDLRNVPAPWKALASDTRLQFRLATTDPSGKKTTGIQHVKTTKSVYAADDSMKRIKSGGTAAWPTDRYLNIRVCSLTGGLLGYAQFPGGPKNTDGVVILNTAFGTTDSARAPFNLGRTTTHEVGHWLNLRHIWADTEDCAGSDYVNDTPNALGPNYGKPTFPTMSCRNGPNGDMFMNYMDYVDDDSMYMFTALQVARMHASLNGARSAIGTPLAPPRRA